MRFRLFVVWALVITALLIGCDSGTIQPTPTSTTEALSTATTQAGAPDNTVTAAPAATVQPNAAPPTSIAFVEPTRTAPSTQKNALMLRAVAVETNDKTRVGVFADERTLNLPQGFHVRVFAAGLRSVRWLGLSPDGLIYATLLGEGQIVTLLDADKDGVADGTTIFADNLPGVQGIAFRDGAVYAATQGQIIRLEDTNKDGVADKRDVLADDLPTGSGHATRTIAFGPDGKLYVSVGSSCNVCKESNEKRAAILRYSADGKFEKVYALGLRNAVGILFHPLTQELWATNNGRDNLGDDIPPETIYNVKEGTNYGWPYCYGARILDKSQDPPAGFCEKTGVPAVEMQAHSAPLGLAFYTGSVFPAEFKGDLFVAFHGSWNRSVPTGYKVVRVRFKDNQPDSAAGKVLVEDFATGWNVSGDVWGRPVDPTQAPDGSLLLTDDKAGAIYSIYYKGDTEP